MFVRFTPNEGLLFHVDPQDPLMPPLTLQLSDNWHLIPELQEQHNVFAVVFPDNAVQLEIDANDVLSVWRLEGNVPEELLYSTPIVSSQLAEQVKQQFRQGVPDWEVVYSRFAENDEENNASTIVGNNAFAMNNVNMNGGKRSNRKTKNRKTKNRKSRSRIISKSRKTRYRKRSLRRTCKSTCKI